MAGAPTMVVISELFAIIAIGVETVYLSLIDMVIGLLLTNRLRTPTATLHAMIIHIAINATAMPVNRFMLLYLRR